MNKTRPQGSGSVLVTARSVAACDEALDRMRAAGLDVRVRLTPESFDPAWLRREVADVDALVTAMEPVDAAVLAAAARLRLIARPGVGTDTVDLAAATRRGVAVTIAAGTNDQSVADFTFALMLEAMRGTSRAAESVRQGGWERVTGSELWGRTLALVGLGRIGAGVARRAAGFDMDVLVVGRPDAALAPQPGDPPGVRRVRLEEALARADIVSLHAPLGPATRHLIDAAALARMKPGAWLINTARGGLVDEPALVDAVRRGHLAGAAVDVLQQQGAGTPSPLVNVPGILVTPHMATFTREATRRVALSVATAVTECLAGRRPAHVVNPDALDPGLRQMI